MKVIFDKHLLRLYHDIQTLCVVENTHGELILFASDFNEDRIKEVRDYVRASEQLERGKYLGKTPVVKSVQQSVIDEYLSDAQVMANDSKSERKTDTTVSQTLRTLLQSAVDMGSSDIHVEQYQNATKVFNRVDGRRILVKDIPDDTYGNEIISHIFMAKAFPKDGDFIKTQANNGKIEEKLIVGGVEKNTGWRCAYIPTISGGKLTMRWTDGEVRLTLDQLGWMPAHVALFRKVISGPSGLILIAGKTNSGKTQILAAGLDEISSERSVHTLEDPTEFSLGIPQTFVNHDQVVIADNKSAKTVSFAMYSRYLLRHDVDVEMHSELRDHAGAMEACRKGETGQIVLASLHCSSAVGIAPTMINQFKVEPSVVASPDLMRLWIYQTLVRTLCSNCKIDSDEALKSYTGKDLDELKIAIAQLKKERIELSGVRFKNLKGCSCCKNTGEKGRTSLVEMILISNEDREFLEQSKYLAWSMHLVKKGYKTVRDHALYKICEGLIDIRTAATKVNDLLPVTADSFYSQLGFNTTSAVKSQPRRTRPARPARTETPLQLEDLSA